MFLDNQYPCANLMNFICFNSALGLWQFVWCCITAWVLITIVFSRRYFNLAKCINSHANLDSLAQGNRYIVVCMCSYLECLDPYNRHFIPRRMMQCAHFELLLASNTYNFAYNIEINHWSIDYLYNICTVSSWSGFG